MYAGLFGAYGCKVYGSEATIQDKTIKICKYAQTSLLKKSKYRWIKQKNSFPYREFVFDLEIFLYYLQKNFIPLLRRNEQNVQMDIRTTKQELQERTIEYRRCDKWETKFHHLDSYTSIDGSCLLCRVHHVTSTKTATSIRVGASCGIWPMSPLIQVP